MIIGTAGHIDHGKTTLVRALTGVDTDRLKEEKARGISIELGYAYTPLPGGDGQPDEVLGFIDVPGHEKFVHTMAAGAVGIDHALLVVAADDGVMPQTREHLAIVLLLGVRTGTVALTKTDRVPPERLAQVQRDIHALLADTPLDAAALFATAATQPDDAGTAALREHLHALARQAAARQDGGLFRLAVDRVFTLAGQGTVVTGTVFAGRAAVGDTLRHSATGQAVRVRSIHAQNRASALARAGQRCALNLTGLDRDDIRRGDWIFTAQGPQASRRIDVLLTLLPDSPDLVAWTPLHVHLGTAHHLAHAVPLDGERLAAGATARVQLVFEADVFVTAGERLILRNAQASRTLGGGPVLDPDAPARRRRSPARQAVLDALQALLAAPPDQAPDPSALIAQAPHGLLLSQLVRLLGVPEGQMRLAPDLLRWPAGAGDALLLAPGGLDLLQARVLQGLDQFHARSPDEPGVNAARLRRMTLPGLMQPAHDALWQGLLAALLAQRQVAQTGPWLHRPSHSTELSAAETLLAERLLPALQAGGFDPPWVRDLARDHRVPEDAVRLLLRKLARQGRLFQIVKDLFYSAEAIAALAAQVAVLAQAAPDHAAQARDFRDACGLGRKRAIQVLEFFDRVGYTLRVGDGHRLRPDAAWSARP
ncbi:selenocysteine-specific translation elongation factor [Amphibiibacter pelophylacis]|uniref:Selenocysteine-specific translation elongation factor n=1 Tax=Amphibiibacter pelophylacis TaxID=1799477 RepID=A0ACC6P1B2_9BURK